MSDDFLTISAGPVTLGEFNLVDLSITMAKEKRLRTRFIYRQCLKIAILLGCHRRKFEPQKVLRGKFAGNVGFEFD